MLLHRGTPTETVTKLFSRLILNSNFEIVFLNNLSQLPIATIANKVEEQNRRLVFPILILIAKFIE